MAQYRFIVSRENEKLFDHLVRSLGELPEIEVILDRRLGPVRSRPRGEEERRLHARVQEDLRTFGWSFVRAKT